MKAIYIIVLAVFYPLFDEFAENIANSVFGKSFYR